MPGEPQGDDGNVALIGKDMLVHEIRAPQRCQELPQSLEQERMHLQTLIDNVPDLIFQKDRESRFVLVNRSLANVAGVSDPKDMIGKTDLQVFPREIAEKFMFDDRVVIETAQPCENIEEPLLSASGSLTWVLTTKVPLLDKAGRVTGLVGIGRDITPRKELEGRNRRLAALVHYADDAIVGFDLNRRIAAWNEGAERLYGYTAEEMLGAPTSLFIPPGLEEEARIMRERVMRDEPVARYDTVRLRKDGSPITVSLTLSAIRDDEGRIVGMASTARDITERKRAEEALRENEEHFRNVVMNAPLGIFHTTAEGKMISANPIFATIMGYGSPEELVEAANRENVAEALYENGVERHAIVEKVMHSRRWEHFEVELRRKNGACITANLILRAYEHPGSGVAELEGFVEDISERKKAEEALHASEERYRELVQNLGVGLAIIDRSAHIQYANPIVEKFFGVPAGGLVGISAIEYVGEEKVTRLLADIERAPRKERFVSTLEVIRFDGQSRTIESTSAPQFDGRGRFAASLVAFHDITELKRLERDLERERKLLLTLINNLPDYVYLKDADGRFILVNQAQASLVGAADPRELVGRRDDDYVAKSLADKYRADDLQIMECGRSRTSIEEQNQDAKGAVKWVLTTKVPLVGLDGKVSGLVGISRDITTRKRTEEALQESEKKYHLLLDTLNEGVWAVDKYDATMFVNPLMASMIGCAQDELLGRNIFDFFRAPSGMAERQLASGTRTPILGQFDGEFIRKDGTTIITRLKVAPIVAEGGEYIGSIASVIDITEQRKAESEVQRLQDQLLQAQKMEAIGRLAGGVAHDFNNLLTTILGNAELIKAKKLVRGIVAENAEEIQKAGLRAAELTHQLLAFSRKQMLQPKVLDLNGLMENLTKMLRRLIGEDITLELRRGAGLGNVRADPGQIEQVILNLVVNARDAMSVGGRLVLETRNVAAGEALRLGRFEVSPGPYVCLTVSDNGIGMDETVKAHIFEPFFTTKERGKGTGLGLSTVYGIVKQSGGYVSVDSEPGRGTSFTIFLPRVDSDDDRQEAPPDEHRPRGGTERILIVEDESSVLKLVTSMLRSFGYTVFGAGTPDDALALDAIKEERGVDLLITDVVLPDMNGTDLARQMQERAPNLRVLFISGYTDETTFREEVLTEVGAFLRKPFTRNSLGRKVREVLDSPRTG